MSYTYNIWNNCYIWILDEEVFCPKCKGKGSTAYLSKDRHKRKLVKCCFCNGTGKVDWISKIMGKESSYEMKYVYRKNKFES